MGIGETAEMLRRSTVHIKGMNRGRPSAGSGVIWNGDGTIITNAHVLGNGGHIVELWDGRTFPAEVKERDDARDLARIKVNTAGLPALTARSEAARAGEVVIAVGNPLGFTGALTTGVVHANGAVAGMGRRRWVQAAIRLAPGNSGGPLADASGHVLGINTMIMQGIMSGGIALAVPSATVEAFLRSGAGPRLGVTVQSVRPDRGKGLGLLVLSVEAGSAAEHASLLIGDVLMGANGTPFQSSADLSEAVALAQAGVLHLRFLRGGNPREREVSVNLEAGVRRRAA